MEAASIFTAVTKIISMSIRCDRGLQMRPSCKTQKVPLGLN